MCCPVYAGDRVEQSADASPQGVVEVHNVRGDVSIIGWQQEQVKVSGTLDDLAEEFVFATQREKTVIKVKLPKDSSYHNRDGSNLKIQVPLGSKVLFNGVATDLQIKNIQGGVEINSVSGNLEVEGVSQNLSINSVSGKIMLKAISGDMALSTVSGDLDAKIVSRKVSVSGVSANLQLNLQEIEAASISNVSGDTQLQGVLIAGGKVRMSSVSGESIYYVDDNLSAKVSIETAPGGQIVNEYNESQPQVSFIQSQQLSFDVGQANSSVKMSTVSGKVGIKKVEKSKK